MILPRIIAYSADWPPDKTASVDLGREKRASHGTPEHAGSRTKACRDEEKLKDYAKAIRENNDVLATLEQGDEKAWALTDNFLSARAAEYEPLNSLPPLGLSATN